VESGADSLWGSLSTTGSDLDTAGGILNVNGLESMGSEFDQKEGRHRILP